eukprot:TRINITY_DN8473_c0_g1_i1.p1 TRINITY_DN8473_c0_g1~~TRINITY_DN8473_c0_g1_i1.p1  ORF type:complete len:552 (+),score=180.58 TRINITY_DN8473_c0_g1_i1:102-1658(+)
MLLKVVGDPVVLNQVRADASQGIKWAVDDSRPLGHPAQLAHLSHLLNLPVAPRAGELPPGYALHRCYGRSAGPSDRLHLDLTPGQNGLLANAFVWVSYRQTAAPPQGPPLVVSPPYSDPADEWGAAGALPVAPPATGQPPQQQQPAGTDAVRRLQLQLLERQRAVEDLGRQLQASRLESQELRRQLLEQSEIMRRQRQRDQRRHAAQNDPELESESSSLLGPAGDPRAAGAEPAPADGDLGITRSGLTVEEIEGELEKTREQVQRLQEEGDALRSELAAAESRARSAELRVEAWEAWKQQHDPQAVAAQQQRDGVPGGSELRRAVEEMRGTLRDILPRREQAKSELGEQHKGLQQRFGEQTKAQSQLLAVTKEVVTPGGAQLMPTPYYLDPYKAPASVYQNAAPKAEGTACQLRVATNQGEGTVVRRMYSATTKHGRRVVVLASLDGVVTDEMVADELTHAGLAYGTRDTLLLATRRHRWVVTMESAEVTRWLDYLCEANPSLRAKQDPGGVYPAGAS